MNHLKIIMLLTGLVMAGGAVAADDLAAGEAVYNKSCKMCHGTGMMGAPKMGDKSSWVASIDSGKERMLNSVINGKGKMPARGNCPACTDQDLANAVAYIISKSQ